MKALLRSGDTPKIILFANTAKSKDIFRMGGNYLQTLNWREDASLMRQIESFYMKANAMDSLALFYEACAQVLLCSNLITLTQFSWRLTIIETMKRQLLLSTKQ